MAKKKTKATRHLKLVGLRLPDELIAELKARAAAEGRTVSNLARRMIEQAVASKASA